MSKKKDWMKKVAKATDTLRSMVDWSKRPDWQRRVADEWVELVAKRRKLELFLKSEKVAGLQVDEYKRMTMQYKVMGLYADILEDRMVHFKTESWEG